MPAEAVATVQGGGVNQGVVTAVAGELTHRNLRATASDRMIFVLLSHAQVIFLRLLHLSANSGIQTHRHFQTLDTAVMHHKVCGSGGREIKQAEQQLCNITVILVKFSLSLFF